MLSIITNFGCDFSCPYCIWRTNSNNHSKYPIIKTNPIDDPKFKELLLANKTDVISLSGGGDPLFRYSTPNSPSRQLFNSLDDLGITYDIHSMNIKELKLAIVKQRNINKIVVHIRPVTADFVDCFELAALAKLRNIKVRFAIVLDESVTDKWVNTLERAFEDVQLSFRQYMTKEGPLPVSDYVRSINSRNKLHMFIEQKDYNTYLMPDNTITTEFLG